ncbi:MAG: hypothetical protein AAFU03_13095, partial [Bacteroidota bacterium]
VYNGINGWQLYTGPGYATPISYHYDDWTHVKIVVSGSRAEIYLNGVTQPAIYLPNLHRKPQVGGIGVWGRDGYFANFRYSTAEPPAIQNEPVTLASMEKGTVTQWMVSQPISGEDIWEDISLSDSQKSSLKWQSLKSENSGTANLAQLNGVSEGLNTVFAKIIINSEREQVKEFAFGFSDAAKVYLNDRAIYTGKDNFRSRDYRFLGTIGYFDSLFLPLKKGKNELWVAIYEGFGGWAIRGKFLDMEGVSVE